MPSTAAFILTRLADSNLWPTYGYPGDDEPSVENALAEKAHEPIAR